MRDGSLRWLRGLTGLTAILAMLGGSARAQVASLAEPPLEVVDESLEPPRGLARVEVSISRTPSGQSPEDKSSTKPAAAKVWRCVLVARGQAVPSACSRTTGWMTAGPGIYDVSVAIWRSAGKPAVFVQPMTVTGRERRILTLLRFAQLEACKAELPSHAKAKELIELESFTLERILPQPDELALRRAWKPHADKNPLYKIENRGSRTWLSKYGTFAGAVQSFSGGTWKHYYRGGVGCPTVAADPPITEDGDIYSSENFFRKQPGPFAPGSYRYIVLVTLDPPETERACAGSPLLSTTNTYELIDEFSISP